MKAENHEVVFECLTVLLGGNSVGESPPTLVIFKGERVPKHLFNNLSESIVAYKSKSGWLNGDIFFTYISNVFFALGKIERYSISDGGIHRWACEPFKSIVVRVL